MARKNRTDLRALRNMIDEAHLLLSTTDLPENRSKRACELLSTALKLADHLLTESPAVTLGKLGGQKIAAKHGPDYFRKLAAKRKTFGGGRPHKQAE